MNLQAHFFVILQSPPSQLAIITIGIKENVYFMRRAICPLLNSVKVFKLGKQYIFLNAYSVLRGW